MAQLRDDPGDIKRAVNSEPTDRPGRFVAYQIEDRLRQQIRNRRQLPLIDFQQDRRRFGIGSDLAWQLMGTVNYRINSRFSLSVGYRHYDVGYEDDGFIFDAAQSGPIVGTDAKLWVLLIVVGAP